MAFLATMAITEEMDHLDLLVQLESRALLDHLGLALFVHHHQTTLKLTF
jgi:hypothetical protein